jgi:hypothetical protein
MDDSEPFWCVGNTISESFQKTRVGGREGAFENVAFTVECSRFFVERPKISDITRDRGFPAAVLPWENMRH